MSLKSTFCEFVRSDSASSLFWLSGGSLVEYILTHTHVAKKQKVNPSRSGHVTFESTGEDAGSSEPQPGSS